MSIKKKFASSAGWMLIGTSSDYIVQFIIFAVLARLLSVSDIGVVAFAIVLIDIGRFFVNSGFSEALVQRPEWDDHVSSVCFTVSVLLAIFFSTLLAVGGGFLLEWYYQAGSGLPTAALASIFILEAMRIVQSAKLRREFRYRSLAARGTAASLLSGVGAIFLALNGWGIWALVIQRLVYQSVMTAATWQSARWTPSLKLDRVVLRELAPFTVRIVVSRSMEVLGNRSPDLLVGLLFGPVGVGFYRIGARGIEAIVRIGIQPFQDAAFAAFSRVGTPALIGQAYLKLTRAAAVLTFPVHLGAATVATEIVVLIFGPKYAESGPIFTALAFGGVSSTIVYFTLAAYLAAGNTGAMLRSSGVALACNLSLVPAVAWVYGPLGAAIGVSLGQTVVAALNLHLLRRHLAVSPKTLLAGVIPPFLAAITMALVLTVVKFQLLADWDVGLRMVVLVALGMVIYPAFILLIGRRYAISLLADMAPLLPSFVTRRARWLFPKG